MFTSGSERQPWVEPQGVRIVSKIGFLLITKPQQKSTLKNRDTFFLGFPFCLMFINALSMDPLDGVQGRQYKVAESPKEPSGSTVTSSFFPIQLPAKSILENVPLKMWSLSSTASKWKYWSPEMARVCFWLPIATNQKGLPRQNGQPPSCWRYSPGR